MRHFSFSLAFFLAAASSLSVAYAEESVTAEVVAVASADTLTLNSNGAQLKVRLFGADAPETGQPFAAQARQWVSAVLLQQRVKVKTMAKDAEGTTVAAITLPDGKDLATELLSQGLAWTDRNAANQQHLVALQEGAKAKRVGLWSENAPVAPWAYREQYGMDSPSYTVASAASIPAAPMPTAPAPVPQAPAAPPQSTSSAVTDISVLEKDFKEVEEPDYLMLAAVHQPRLLRNPSGEVLGLTAESISAIPYAKSFGFQDGDVITAINGERITSEAQIFAMADRLHGTKRFEVDIVRGGAPHRVNIQVK